MLLGFTLIALAAEAYYQYSKTLAPFCEASGCGAQKAIQTAITLRPLNSRYLEQAAQLGLRTKNYPQALDYFQQLIHIRPTWPHYWASTAAILLDSSLVGNDRGEFDHAWARAIETGRYEYELQRDLLRKAIPRWYVLNSRQRLDILALVASHCDYRPKAGRQLIRLGASPRVRKLIAEACANE